MFGKKKTLGFKKPQRTLDEINKDYNFHAAQAGHKGRVVKKILSEIEHHEDRMENIDAEAKLLPKEPPKPAEPVENSPAPEVA